VHGFFLAGQLIVFFAVLISLSPKNEKSGKKDISGGTSGGFDPTKLHPRDLLPLWSGFAPILSRELPFSLVKFLVFDVLSRGIVSILNSQAGVGALPIQVGVGPVGLAASAAAGAVAGVASAVVTQPADLILTYTSSAKAVVVQDTEDSGGSQAAAKPLDWRDVVKELTSREGGWSNLFVGLPARATFFFLVIGLQFFLYDYVKGLFQVGSDDLSLVLDVFYAVRAGL
jgi:Mitochondrial carrier protein